MEPAPHAHGRLRAAPSCAAAVRPGALRHSLSALGGRTHGVVDLSNLWLMSCTNSAAMLTMEPGPDIAPCHDRQIGILERKAWADWLDPSVSAESLIKPLPAGSPSRGPVGLGELMLERCH